MRLKRLLFFLPLVALWSFSQATIKDDQVLNILDFSGGLNSNYSSLTIADNEVHDALNVYFTKDNLVTKRRGYSLYGSTGTFSFQSAWQYVDASNNIWMIVRSSDAIRASLGNGTFSVKIATVPTPATSLVSAVSAFGKIYFVDNVQGVYSWDGTTLAYISGSPHGTIITEFHGRLWVAGLSVPTQNYLYGSAYLDGATWTTGTLATDPVLYQIGLNDRADGITAFWSGYNDTLYIFKTLSINALYGFDQTDFQLRILSREAGCIDSGSLQAWKGYLYFMSQRGIERFDGSFPVRISNKIKDKVDPATFNFFSSRSWIQRTAADWGGASYTNSVYVDSESVTNSLMTTFPDTFSTYRDGTSGTKKVWTAYNSSDGSGSVSVSGGNLQLVNNGNAIGKVNVRTNLLSDFQQGTTYHFVVNAIPANINNTGRFYVTLSSLAYSTSAGLDPSALSSHWYYQFASTITNQAWLQGGTNEKGDSILTSSSGVTIPFTFDLWLSTTNFSYSINGIQVKAGTHTWPHNQVAAYFSCMEGDPTTGTCLADNFQVAPQLFSYTSPIEFLGNSPSTFGQLGVTQDVTTGGTIAYSVCTSANSDMSAKTCSAQTANAQITQTINKYAQIVSTFSTTGLTQQPAFSSLTLNWIDGTLRPRMSSVVYDDRYWLALATNTADTTNDATIVVSERDGNHIFTLFNINAGAYLLYKNTLYHADANATGKVYLDDVGYSDNGSAISAYITTKDYAPGGIIADKYFEYLYVISDALGNYSLSTTYYLDRNTILPYMFSDITQNEQTGLINLALPFPFDSTHQKFGRTISFKFSNAIVDQPFGVYGGTIKYRLRDSIGNLNAQ